MKTFLINPFTSEETLRELSSYVEELREYKKERENFLITEAIKNLKNRCGWNISKVGTFMAKLYSLDKYAFEHIMLKEIERALYKDAIADCESFYILSRITDDIIPIKSRGVKFPENIARFMTEEDAIHAYNAVKRMEKEMTDEQENKKCKK